LALRSVNELDHSNIDNLAAAAAASNCAITHVNPVEHLTSRIMNYFALDEGDLLVPSSVILQNMGW